MFPIYMPPKLIFLFWCFLLRYASTLNIWLPHQIGTRNRNQRHYWVQAERAGQEIELKMRWNFHLCIKRWKPVDRGDKEGATTEFKRRVPDKELSWKCNGPFTYVQKVSDKELSWKCNGPFTYVQKDENQLIVAIKKVLSMGFEPRAWVLKWWAWL
jgi:hypothetical protein